MEKNYREAMLYRKYADEKVECRLCSHYCKISQGESGICKVRRNIDGRLYSLNWGAADGAAIDPVEKKPLYHFKPGSKCLSFGSYGCNFICSNCQNSSLSQRARHGYSKELNQNGFSPEKIVDAAIKANADGIAYTYSEPTVFFEYCYDTIMLSRNNQKAENLYHVFVSNGFMSCETAEFIIAERLIDAINIDLKFIESGKYKRICGGKPGPVLENIARFFDAGIHIEITNLIIPDENDGKEDIERLCAAIAAISKEIPLHFSRFYPQYRMLEKPATSAQSLIKAKEIAAAAGLKYVYLGNIAIDGASDTTCPKCGKLLIERLGYQTRTIGLDKNNNGIVRCLFCGEDINIVL